MMKYRRSLLAVFTVLLLGHLFAFTQAASALEPKPYRAVYVAVYKYFPIKGTAVRELRKTENGRWMLTDQVKSPLVNVLQTSEFDWIDGKPKPIAYRYKLGGIAKNRMETQDFDWDQLKVASLVKKHVYEYDITPDTSDKLSYHVKLRHDMMTDGTPSSYHLASRRRAVTYEFEVLGEERIKTKIGYFDTVKIARKRGPDSKRKTFVWLAKDWDYMMVKLRQVENSKSYEIILSEAQLDGVAVLGQEKNGVLETAYITEQNQ